MMSLLDRFRGHESAHHSKADGLELAVATVEEFKARKFRFRGAGMKAAGLPAEEVIRFVEEELPDYYTYTTRVKTYSDRRKTAQARIEITGTMGLSRELNRYNPLDVSCTIKTEKPIGR
jgi:hypothetical protein